MYLPFDNIHIRFDKKALRTNWKVGNDQESIQTPSTFRPRHQGERGTYLKQQHHKQKTVRKKSRKCQSQTAALPRHQEEQETDKTKQTQIEQTYEQH